MNLLKECYKRDPLALPDAWRTANPSSQNAFLRAVVRTSCNCSDDDDDLDDFFVPFELRLLQSMDDSRYATITIIGILLC